MHSYLMLWKVYVVGHHCFNLWLATHSAANRIQWYISSSTLTHLPQGWGLLSQFPPFRYFPNFSALSKQTLAFEYHVYIWQVSPQLSCGDICQILMWFEKSYMYFCHIENFAYGENNERSFSNPHPWTKWPPFGQRTFLNAFSWIKSCEFQFEFFPRGPADNKWALVLVIAWRWTGDKPLTEPILTQCTDANMRH